MDMLPYAVALAARLEHLVKGLYFPSHRVPFQLLDRVRLAGDRQVRDQLPLDPLTILRRTALGRMNHRQLQIAIALLLADRRADPDLLVLDFQHRRRRLALVVAHLDAMYAPDALLLHHFIDRSPVVLHSAIVAGAEDELGAQRLTFAEQFVDVALAVADVDDAG